MGMGGALMGRMPVFGSPVPPDMPLETVDVALKKQLADVALNAAKSKGASYADVRIGRYRNQFIITREDKVRQAVSLWKAVQTQAWKREEGEQPMESPELVFSFRAINYLVRLLTAHDASWDAYFVGLGYEPLKLTYEELAEDTEGVVRRVLEHLGIPVPEGLESVEPRLSVQADEVSEDWVRRVHEHLAALEEPAPA